MTIPLVGLHAWFGEFGALMFVWAFIELYSGKDTNINRARFAVLMGTMFLVAAWLAGGFYYTQIYGIDVKPLIKAGPLPWVHSVALETKEHVFLFLPFLAVLTWGLMQRYDHAMSSDLRARKAGLLATGSIVVLAGGMAFAGFLVSSGYRMALEALIK